jgi:hypothetical protein
MILLLVIATWIVALSLVVGLCVAARVGDLQPLRRTSGAAGSEYPQLPIWEPAPHQQVAAYAKAPSAGSPDAEVLSGSRSLAA